MNLNAPEAVSDLYINFKYKSYQVNMDHKHLAGDQTPYVIAKHLDSYDYFTDGPNGYPLCVSKFEMGMNSLKMTKQIIRQDTYVY